MGLIIGLFVMLAIAAVIVWVADYTSVPRRRIEESKTSRTMSGAPDKVRGIAVNIAKLPELLIAHRIGIVSGPDVSGAADTAGS
jgi:hypothetical protein